MAELFKFRCSGCTKLLGIAPSKVGRTIQCPRCGTDLIVPSPDDAEEDLTDDSPGAADLGINLGFASPLDLRPPERTPPPTPEHAPIDAEAIAFLDQIAVGGLPESEPPSSRPGSELESSGPSDFDDEEDEDPLIATPVEPLTRPPRRASRAREESFDRRRDVILPRTGVIAWAMFALFALAFSFVAGLMIGHYRWK